MKFLLVLTGVVRSGCGSLVDVPGHNDESNVRGRFGELADPSDLTGGDRRYQRLDLGDGPVHQPPVHERLHVAAVGNAGQEVGNEKLTAGLQQREQATRQAQRGVVAEVVVETGRIDQVEAAVFAPARGEIVQLPRNWR